MKSTIGLLLILLALMFPRISEGQDLLSLAGEPALPRKPGVEQFRLIYAPTFERPMILRVTKTPDGITLRAVQFSGAGGYDVGRPKVNRTVTVTPQQWERIQALAKESRFWSLPAKDDTQGLDGSSWVFEGVSPSAQHKVSRWTPSYETKKRKLEGYVRFGRYLVELSGLKADLG